MDENARLVEATIAVVGMLALIGAALHLMSPQVYEGEPRYARYWRRCSPWLTALWQRYFVVQIPHQPSAPAAPRTDGAGRAHAENSSAVSARTAPNPPIGGALDADLVTMLRLIAAHKIEVPSDGKTATAKALGIARSGTSEKYQRYSAAWDLLYPIPIAPPILPANDERDWKNEDGNLVRIDATGQPAAR